MAERILVHNPAVVTKAAAISRAPDVGCTVVMHGLAGWMATAGITYGNDGYVAVIVCGVPEHAASREVLATLKDANLTEANVLAVEDHT